MYLLDTDICVFLLKDKYDIKQKIKEREISNCYISEITLAELMYGAHKSTNFKKHIHEVSEVEKLFNVLPIYASFPVFAEEKVRLQKAGILIPDFDLLIGTTALQHNFILVTHNTKHFSRIQNLKIEDWTKSDDVNSPFE